MSRIAVLSDVHGNTPALRAVLDDIRDHDVDVIVNLGDIASGGVDPSGTIALLRTRPDILTVRGNHERQVLTLDVDAMTPSDRLAHAALTPDDRDWLGSLPFQLLVENRVLAVHGTPHSDMQYLMHTVDPTGIHDASDDDVRGRIHGVDADVIVCGHTHLRGIRHLPGGPLIVNPGSVGWPAYVDDVPYPHVVESGSTAARWSLLEEAGTSWTVTERDVEYDTEAAAALAISHDRPDVAYALRTGRVGS